MGKTVMEILENVDYPFTCALVNNQRIGFNEEIEEESNIELLSVESGEGRRTYERSIVFITKAALRAIDPSLLLIVKNSLEDALYCEIEGKNGGALNRLKEEVKKIIDENNEIKKFNLPKETAIRKLEKEHRIEDTVGIKYLLEDTIPLYELKGLYNYFAGPLLPNTGLVKVYSIVPFENGFLILFPSKKDLNLIADIPERPKLFEAFKESNNWAEKLEIKNVADINKSIVNGKISNIIKIQETLHEIKIGEIANQIIAKGTRLVLIAGPSSSGKTTFAKRLEIQIKANGLKPFVISTDNYFVDRDKTPLDENGNPDFEAIDALNYKLLEIHIKELLSGKDVDIPRFNFITGKNEKWKKIKIDKNGIIIIEGIHSLNPMLMDEIDDSIKFKVYVSALSQINIDNVNRIPTRDLRLIRRIVRDAHFRGIAASDTIRRWNQVIKGEDKYIFPFQESADAIFNSALIYELAILRVFAEAPLRAIDSKEKEYSESLRLLNFLSHFIPLLPDEVPQTSILREFIGKSSFKY